MELGINVCLHRKFFQTAPPKKEISLPKHPGCSAVDGSIYVFFFTLSYPKQLSWTLVLPCAAWKTECLEYLDANREGAQREV